MTLEEKKNNAMAFYKMAFDGNPEGAVHRYVGQKYTQHNPDVADGIDGFIDYFQRMHDQYPEKKIEFVRCIAEGDLVVLHTHQIWPGDDLFVTSRSLLSTNLE